jgi:macrolide transport system ATP-binding/permease protein
VIVCVLGACIGVVLSILVAHGASSYLEPEWRLHVSAAAMLASALSAVIAGMVFGYTPARNDARLDSVSALARE